jgi:Toprim domain
MSNQSLARRVTEHLGGKWWGSYGIARGPGHSKLDRSLTIRPHHSNPHDVVLHSFTDDDWRGIKDELREAGILPEWGGKTPSRPVDPAAERAAKERGEKEAKREAERADNKRWRANNLWKRRQPAEGTVVEQYLRDTRGLRNPPFDMIGYLPAGMDRDEPRYPAMIAAFGLPEEYEPGRLRLDDATGVHLTFLDGANKAPIERKKQMRGTCKGLPLVLAAPNDGNAICIAEGIETALTAHDLLGVGAWAAGSANFLPALADVVPACIECVWIEAEEDPAGQSNARELAARLAKRGFEVRLVGAV